jgi:hypothetical protein
MTLFVINLAKPFLKYMGQSLIDYGHPSGLMALILVAVSPMFVPVLRCTQKNEVGACCSGI